MKPKILSENKWGINLVNLKSVHTSTKGKVLGNRGLSWSVSWSHHKKILEKFFQVHQVHEVVSQFNNFQKTGLVLLLALAS